MGGSQVGTLDEVFSFVLLIVKPRKLHSLIKATLLLARFTLSLRVLSRYRVMLRNDPLRGALALDKNDHVVGVALSNRSQ